MEPSGTPRSMTTPRELIEPVRRGGFGRGTSSAPSGVTNLIIGSMQDRPGGTSSVVNERNPPSCRFVEEATGPLRHSREAVGRSPGGQDLHTFSLSRPKQGDEPASTRR
jgi:hypothetical protein